jgi:hypothetical protein
MPFSAQIGRWESCKVLHTAEGAVQGVHHVFGKPTITEGKTHHGVVMIVRVIPKDHGNFFLFVAPPTAALQPTAVRI